MCINIGVSASLRVLVPCRLFENLRFRQNRWQCGVSAILRLSYGPLTIDFALTKPLASSAMSFEVPRVRLIFDDGAEN